jgi:hypothetical protein
VQEPLETVALDVPAEAVADLIGPGVVPAHKEEVAPERVGPGGRDRPAGADD